MIRRKPAVSSLTNEVSGIARLPGAAEEGQQEAVERAGEDPRDLPVTLIRAPVADELCLAQVVDAYDVVGGGGRRRLPGGERAQQGNRQPLRILATHTDVHAARLVARLDDLDVPS